MNQCITCIYTTHSQIMQVRSVSAYRDRPAECRLSWETVSSKWWRMLKGTKWTGCRCGKKILPLASATISLFVLLNEQLMSPHLCFLHLTSQFLPKGLRVLSYLLHKDVVRWLISQCLWLWSSIMLYQWFINININHTIWNIITQMWLNHKLFRKIF